MTNREDLYQQAIELYESLTGRRALGAVGAVVDLVLDARQPWEVLREAAEVVSRVEMQTEYIRARIEWLAETANVLEAERQAAQEKAAAEDEREKLIEQAARVLHHAGSLGQQREWRELGEKDREFFMIKARALADAGFLSAPTTDGGAA